MTLEALAMLSSNKRDNRYLGFSINSLRLAKVLLLGTRRASPM